MHALIAHAQLCLLRYINPACVYVRIRVVPAQQMSGGAQRRRIGCEGVKGR